METYGDLWGACEGLGGLWSPVGACEVVMGDWGAYGGLWGPVVVCGSLWRPVGSESRELFPSVAV